MPIDVNVIDHLLADFGRRPEDIVGENGLLKKLTKPLLERALKETEQVANRALTQRAGWM